MKHKILFILMLGIINQLYAQNVDIKEIDKKVQEKSSIYSPLSCVVSITKSGKIIYQKAYGFSNIEMQVKARPTHKFRIGSNTKQFTAIAILKLVEEKKIKLEDSIQQFFPEFPYAGKAITIENLLTHTSGISDYTSKEDWFSTVSKAEKQPVELVNYFQNDSTSFLPGEMFEYNNSGYHLLGCIIEKVTGKTYQDYLKEIIFKPLNMDNTICLSSFEVVPELASGYDFMNNKVFNPDFVHPTQAFSAGNIVSTVDDISKWYRGLFSGKVLTKTFVDKAISPFSLNNGTWTHYGFGWQIDTIQNSPAIYHGGAYPGYLSQTLYFLNEEVLVTVLSNSMPLEQLAKQIGAIAINKPLPTINYINLSKSDLNRFSGQYSNGAEKWLFTENDGKFYYKIADSNKFQIKPVKENLFYSEDWDIYCEFLEDKDQMTFLLHLRGEKLEYVKDK